MKQMVVLFSMIILGLAMYAMIAGGDDSLVGGVKDIWQHEIDMRTRNP